MRSLQPRLRSPLSLRRQVERLSGLPLRPTTVRAVLQGLPETEVGDDGDEPADSPRSQLVTEIDPGWVLGLVRQGASFDPLREIAERPWWSQPPPSASEALSRQWRHAVAASQAARRLARDASDADPERVARAALLHGLGRWAIAAIDPEWLARWLAEADPDARLTLEHRTLGAELTTLGRVLAERWGCDPLVVDAAWLHADAGGTLNGCASEPARLALIQQAYACAEQTPWGLVPAGVVDGVREPSPPDPRLRLLTAEVQVRCGGGSFVEADATPHEERWARSNARLRRQLVHSRTARQSSDRFLAALASGEPSESPETWAERAGLCWCGEPGVTAARVLWTGPNPSPSPSPDPHAEALPETSLATPSSPALPAPDEVLPLLDRGRPCAEVHLWKAGGSIPGTDARPTSRAHEDGLDLEPVRRAWEGWAGLVAERARLAGRLERVVRIHRERLADEEPRLRQAKLAALAEFAAGAGHELNNPLAVIVGRAQLLLARETDPAAIRSLRAILNQAQRAHRILRDLMYVARPPEPRPRYCQPEEIVRNCLRDLRDGAEERGVRLAAESRGANTRIWADPDALRHITEVLLRNALEATPKGGTVQLTLTASTGAVAADQAAGADVEALTWTVQDSGRGMTAADGQHLFDPFYCGRQAGRGLGLGLPRAARIVSQSGGSIRWHATPGLGTTFHVHLPLGRPPQASVEAGVTPSPQAEDPPLARS